MKFQKVSATADPQTFSINELPRTIMENEFIQKRKREKIHLKIYFHPKKKLADGAAWKMFIHL